MTEGIIQKVLSKYKTGLVRHTTLVATAIEEELIEEINKIEPTYAFIPSPNGAVLREARLLDELVGDSQ